MRFGKPWGWWAIAGLMAATMVAVAEYSSASQASSPGMVFNQAIFEVKDGRISAPLAKRMPAALPEDKGMVTGWTPASDDDYAAFDADSVFPKERGTMEVSLVVLGDAGGKPALGKFHESLVMLYDDNGVPFFTLGLNDHDITVGSFPLNPTVMEDAFGGTAFNYLAALGGPPGKGTEMTVTVTWGTDPAEDRVYVNGKPIGLSEVKGPRTLGKGPGFKPTATLASFMGGFSGYFDGINKTAITPPRTLVVGRIGSVEKAGGRMLPPRSVAIKKIRLSNVVETPNR